MSREALGSHHSPVTTTSGKGRRQCLVFHFPLKALQSLYYHSPWKNEETEAQKEKALGHQDSLCRDRKDFKMLLLRCPAWGISLLPNSLHLPAWQYPLAKSH